MSGSENPNLCQTCGKGIPEGIARCPFCDAEQPRSSGLAVWQLVALAAFVAAVAAYMNYIN